MGDGLERGKLGPSREGNCQDHGSEKRWAASEGAGCVRGQELLDLRDVPGLTALDLDDSLGVENWGRGSIEDVLKVSSRRG